MEKEQNIKKERPIRKNSVLVVLESGGNQYIGCVDAEDLQIAESCTETVRLHDVFQLIDMKLPIDPHRGSIATLCTIMPLGFNQGPVGEITVLPTSCRFITPNNLGQVAYAQYLNDYKQKLTQAFADMVSNIQIPTAKDRAVLGNHLRFK